MTAFTPGPYSTEAFNEIFAGVPNYQAMIIGGDGETIVAQCVAERDVGLLTTAPDLYGALEELLAASRAVATDYPSTIIVSAWDDADAALARARGEQP